jgi:hypothetical protein
VPQSPVLFGCSIRDNLDPWGRASDQQLAATLQVTLLSRWLSGLSAPCRNYKGVCRLGSEGCVVKQSLVLFGCSIRDSLDPWGRASDQQLAATLQVGLLASVGCLLCIPWRFQPPFGNPRPVHLQNGVLWPCSRPFIAAAAAAAAIVLLLCRTQGI